MSRRPDHGGVVGGADKSSALRPLSVLKSRNVSCGWDCGMCKPPMVCTSQGDTVSILGTRTIPALLGPHRSGQRDVGAMGRRERES